MDFKALMFNVAPPVFLVGFLLFARFVSGRLPVEQLFGWRLFCAGGFTAIAGLAIAVHFTRVEAGATVVMVGAILAAVGLGKFLLSR